MKIKRQKTVKRFLMFYRNNFNLKPPYQVLIDGTFCRAALKFKINIAEQLPKYLANEVELLTTSCAIKECEMLGTLLYGPLKLLRQYRMVACKHPKSPDGIASAASCLHSFAKKPDQQYFFATQDKELSEKLRKMPGRPLLYIAYNAVHLEPPATASQSVADSATAAKLDVSENSKETLVNISKGIPGDTKPPLLLQSQTSDQPKPKKRRGPKGPNPLSCKKAKKKQPTAPQLKRAKTEKINQ